MNSLYRYLIRIITCLGLWIMIFPGLGMGYAAELPSKVNSGRPADGGGKIIMLKLNSESPQKPFQISAGDIRTQQPPPAKMPLQFHRSSHVHQDASAKMSRKRSESKPAQQPDAKPQLSDAAAPINAQPQPETEYIAETPAIQEPINTEALMPAGQPPLLTEKPRPEPLQADNAPSVSIKKDDNIQTAPSQKLAPEYALQQDSIQDTVGIIARLLLKFSLIVVCCIALYFSFSALQIAKTNQRFRYRVDEENGAR